jgi:pRiA4b ORF-3-like protein
VRPLAIVGFVARDWFSIRVELVGGGGADLWPRPGRIFAAAPAHTFKALGDAIDDAFARWDRAHLQEFTLADGNRLADPDPDWAEPDETLDHRRVKLNRLALGEQFVYVFDLGDDWAHLCTVGEARVDPVDTFGIRPDRPLPYWGWGTIPDQYGRRWDGDDGESDLPANPGTEDLPPLRHDWGPQKPG